VFDIEQPVAIGIFCSTFKSSTRLLTHSELIGNRRYKYQFLQHATFKDINYTTVVPAPPTYRFTSTQSQNEDEYLSFYSLSDICPLFAEGIKTGRDWLVVDFEDAPVLQRIGEIRDSENSDDALCNHIGLSRKKAWNLTKARASLREANLSMFMDKLIYRPFDRRSVFYHPQWIASPSFPVMRNLWSARETSQRRGGRRNIAILAGRTSRDKLARLYWCSNGLTDKCILSSLDNVSVFPALVYREDGDELLASEATCPEPNLSKEFLDELGKHNGCRKADPIP
jgi:hypothetical protein